MYSYRLLGAVPFSPAIVLLFVAGSNANSLSTLTESESFVKLLDDRRPIANERVSAINKLSSDKEIDWTAAYNERFALMHPDERRRMQGAFSSPHNKRNRAPLSIALESADTTDYNDESAEEHLPTSFDVREAWPECAVFAGYIPDQSTCGSCWAVATASVVTDRNCIEASRAGHALDASDLSNWASAEDILTCAPRNYGCDGGWTVLAFDYVDNSGVMTGSPAYAKTPDPDAGCKPYPFPPAANATGYYNAPKCTKSNCTNDNSTDTTRIRSNTSYTELTKKPGTSLERDMMAKLQANGSVTAVMVVYEDFFYYKFGVYTNTTTDFAGLHAVRIIGWGVVGNEKHNTSYWLVANSWGSDWGETGFFRIRRGSNVCGIESDII